jgi:hypothetical protein
MNDEEFEFSGGGVHSDLARVLRICAVGGAPHGEFEGRYSPPETGWKMIEPAAKGRGI